MTDSSRAPSSSPGSLRAPGAGRFAGRVAVVTGAGSGVGAATALRLAAEGAAVVVADIDKATAEASTAAIVAAGGEAQAVTVDVAEEDAVRDMIARAVETYGRLDILHNNAAALGAATYGRDVAVADLDLEVWQRTMSVNTNGVLLGCKHAVPAMKAAGGGSIVNTVSVAAFHGGDDHAAYGTSKAAIVALTRYVASMYGPDQIRANAVAPGLIMSATSKAVLSERDLAEFAVERALPWAAEPEDVAAAVVWLASDEARCITGQTIVVDSGILARRPRDVLKAWDAVSDRW